MVKAKTLKIEDVPPYQSLLEAVERAYNDVKQARYKLKDLALVSIIVYTGCRIGEAIKLTREDINIRERYIRLKQLKKHSEFQRLVPVPSNLFWEIMERYLRRVATRHLFPSPKGDTPMTERQARNVVYKWSKRYLKRKIRPHAIRHSYAIEVLRVTKNLEAVRRLLGHEDYSTIKIYLNLTQQDLEDELKKVFEKRD
jgi:site-specific recombinase XerD